MSSFSISPADLNLVHVNLRLFVTLYPMLYGPKFSGLEVHMLKHSAQDGMCAALHTTSNANNYTVKELGPLFTHSAFVFEHMGGRSVYTCHNKRTGVSNTIFNYYVALHNHKLLMRERNFQPGDCIISKYTNITTHSA